MTLQPGEYLDTAEQELAAELCQVVLSGLSRSDQRRTGLAYVLGMLAAQGRKTVRGIAGRELTQDAYEQRLHHFISKSTWSSHGVLAKLADHVQTWDRPEGWVIRPMVVEKHGDKSVGVKNEVVPCLGKVVNHQHVLATWFMGSSMEVPVDWRLVIPECWAADDERRSRAGVPARTDSPTSSHAAAALIKALRPGAVTAPVVMDSRETDAARVIRAAQAKGLPYLLRIPGSAVLSVARSGAGPAPTVRVRAQRLAEVVRPQQRLVPGPVPRTSGRVPVSLSTAEGPIATTMVSVWSSDAGWAGVWLTDLEDDLGRIVARTDLVAAADDAFSETARPLGAVDYEGRSFVGWQHHMAMVSVAHAVRTYARTGDLADAPGLDLPTGLAELIA